MKLFSWYGDLSQKAKKEDRNLNQEKLWILTTSASEEFLTSFDKKKSLGSHLQVKSSLCAFCVF
jgi:hypothetical protein